MSASFNNFEALQQVEAAYLDTLNGLKSELSDLEFEESRSPSSSGPADILILERAVDKA